MRIAVIGGFMLAGLLAVVGAAVSWPNVGFAQRIASGSAGSGGLIAIPSAVGEGRQQLTVIDPELRVMSVYHIESASGEITLKSVRKLHWDLQMDEFNGTSPLPRDIRSLLEQK
jgi:hypothetical protein